MNRSHLSKAYYGTSIFAFDKVDVLEKWMRAVSPATRDMIQLHSIEFHNSDARQYAKHFRGLDRLLWNSVLPSGVVDHFCQGKLKSTWRGGPRGPDP